MIFLELQMMERAIIASRVGALPETITDGLNGYLVSAENHSEMAQKMSLLLDNPELCRTMGQNGRKRVLDEFSLEKRGEQYQRFLADIVGRGRP